MKKVAIIGGGIAGLTAGIYLQQAGFETTIYERNPIAGGECMGWKREGFFIDNCIHWLTGTKEGSGLNELWKNIGAIGEDIEMRRLESFSSSELNGQKVVFWRDLERTRKELLALSPEDADEINKLIDYTKLGEGMSVPVEKPFDRMNLFDFMKLGKSMGGMGKLMKEYGKLDLNDWAERFKHPLIRQAIRDCVPPRYLAYTMMVSYATITSDNGNIPRGGSLEMVLRIVKRYETLGGKLITNQGVKKVNLEGKKATGITLENDEVAVADYVVCACDVDYTFSNLLPASYMPADLKNLFANRETYPVFSDYHAAFAVDGVCEELAGNNNFDCETMVVAGRNKNRLGCRGYGYEPDFAPEGKSVLISGFCQDEQDYAYWSNLYQNQEAYKEEKNRVAQEMMKRIEQHWPYLQGKLHLLDAWSPVTYTRYCNAYRGAYMSFVITRDGKSQRTSGRIKGLSNVMMASQWLMGPGGLPVAAATGRFAAYYIEEAEKKHS